MYEKLIRNPGIAGNKTKDSDVPGLFYLTNLEFSNWVATFASLKKLTVFCICCLITAIAIVIFSGCKQFPCCVTNIDYVRHEGIIQ